jgi:hypothetical protein
VWTNFGGNKPKVWVHYYGNLRLFLKPSMVLMHELVVTLPDKHTKQYSHVRLFYIGLFKLACFIDPIISIYFIPEFLTKGFELSTLAHALSPFVRKCSLCDECEPIEWI